FRTSEQRVYNVQMAGAQPLDLTGDLRRIGPGGVARNSEQCIRDAGERGSDDDTVGRRRASRRRFVVGRSGDERDRCTDRVGVGSSQPPNLWMVSARSQLHDSSCALAVAAVMK